MSIRQAKSTNGVFDHVVSATDGLLKKMKAPPARSTFNTVSYLSGSKTGYGLNLQATCDAEYRFGGIFVIAQGGANNWAAWTQYTPAKGTGCKRQLCPKDNIA